MMGRNPLRWWPRRRRLPVAGAGETHRVASSAEAAALAVRTALDDDPLVGRATLVQLAGTAAPLLADPEVARIVSLAWERHQGLGPIAPLLADPMVTEVLINGPGPVTVERAGALSPSDVSVDADDIDLLIERILAPLGLRVDRTSPIVDARLADGSRVNIVVPPLAVDGPTVCIRRFGAEPPPLAAFGPPALGTILAGLVAEGASMLVVGPTSSGKTSLLNALGRLIDGDERIICIEDTSELQLPGDGVVRLEARPANSEGVGGVTLRQLVLTSLRMRPDRLVIGEVRGAEAFDLLLAMTGGHRGCLATCHAADGPSGLRRLEVLAALAGTGVGRDELRALIADGLDAVVVVERAGSGRRVRSVELLDGGRLVPCWRADRPIEEVRAA